MSDKKRSPRGKPSSSNPSSARLENPNSPHQWDLEPDASNRLQRIRASSWDDSDENSTSIPESKSSRIYSSDDPKIKGSISSEINELKKQFFQNLEKTKKLEASSFLEELEQKLFSDRRQSPARVKRRTKSSGSLSPVLEIENQTSPKKSTRDADFLEVSPKAFEYDPSYYLNNFFTELRNRRINLLEPTSVTENLEEEIPKFDRDCIEMYNELSAVDATDSYFYNTGKKLSQILEVEESRKDLEKPLDLNSGGQTTPRDIDISPLATARSKKSQKSSENVYARKNEFKSFSSEYFINYKKLPKPSSECLSERSANIFDHKLDHEIISLSPKFGKTHLATSSKMQEEKQLTSNFNQNEEKKDDSLESLTTTDISTVRKSTRSEKSRQKWNPESPKFMLNIEGNSARSFKPDEADITDCCRNDSDKNLQTEGSSRSSNRSERSFKGKTENNSQPGSIESINLTSRSSKHDHSINSSQSSHKKKRKQRNSITNSETECSFIETNSPAGSLRSVEKTTPQTSGRSVTEQEKTQSGRTSTTPKVKTPKTGENKFQSDKITPRSTKIPELGLHLDISERSESQKSSQRTLKTAEETASDRSNINKPKSRKSERSSSSKSRHTRDKAETRTSTPRGYKKGSTGNTWRRSKDSLDNQDSEHSGMSPSKNLEKVCDTVSNSVSSTSRSSLRELEIPNNQLSSRSEVSLHEPEVFQRESESRRSSRRSVRSHVTDTIHNSPTSVKTKSRPNSWTSREEIPENPDLENTDSITESWSFIVEEDEDVEDINPTPRNGEETDRYKRLSIINEVSFEDLETSNVSIEKDDTKDPQTGWKSKLDSPRTPGTPRSVSITPKGSTKKPSNESGSIEIGKTDDGKWSELLETFRESSNSLENNFPGFQDQKEISWDSLKSTLLSEKMVTDEKTPRKSTLETNISNEKPAKIDEDLNLEFEDRISLMDKMKQNEDNVSVQNLYYLNVDQGKPFGMGEFGDVTSWNVADNAAKDDKPKDHGDGVPMQKPLHLTHHKPERKEKEPKTQRQLWTELREDFRDSKPFLNNLFHGGEEDFDEFTSTTLKTSKSDNYINTKTSEGSDYQNSVVSFLLNDDQTEVRVESTPKTTMQRHSSSESVQSENENLEFDCERTPRLSRSLSSLDIRLQDREPSETSNSRSQLFKKTLESCKQEKESTNLNIFLVRKEKKDKIHVKSNNWLKLKSSDAENPFKQGKKVKRKLKKKGATSSRQGYLSSRSRTPVPSIKLRKSNCFRNFYKRFISVFCLTSNSSAATS